MRFHIGFSFGWKEIKRLIIPILIAIGLYFGLTANVHAESLSLPITGGGGGLTYSGGTSGGQTSWCTKSINSTEYVYRCGGLYDDTFSAGLDSTSPNNLLQYSTQWWTNTNSLCSTSQTSIEFYVYAYPVGSTGTPYDFWDYYDIASIAYPSSANSTCTYSRIQKNMLKVNCVYNSGASVQFNIYGSLNNKIPPNSTNFQMLIRRNINYTCTATNQDINNSINSGFNNLSNVIIDNFKKLNDDVTSAMTNPDITDAEKDANGFFDDFNMNDHGVNTIVTAPLRLINGLLDGTSCSYLNIKFSLRDTDKVIDKEVALPSGCKLWNNVPSAVVTLYQTIVFGLVAYRYLLALKKTISNVQNPTKDDIEVIDL